MGGRADSASSPFLKAGSRWKLSEPGVEDLQLVFWRIKKFEAHANSLLDVDNLSLRHESALLVGNAHGEQCSDRKNVQDVHVTSFATNFRDPPRKLRCARRVCELRRCDEGVARCHASLAVRRGRITWRIGRIFQCYIPWIKVYTTARPA